MEKLHKHTASVILILLFCLHFLMALRHEVNWDEFFRLARIYEWERGSLAAVFESGYIYLFTWLKFISNNEVTQIIAARLVMLALLIGSSFCLYQSLKIIFSAAISKTAVIFYLGFTYVIGAATSFRVDPIVLFLLMIPICLLLRPLTLRNSLIAGACIGAAGFISLKSVFYVPTIACLLIWQIARSDQKIRDISLSGTTGILAILTFVGLIVAHGTTLSTPEQAGDFMKYAAGASLLKYGWFPQLSFLTFGLKMNILYGVVFVLGVVRAASLIKQPEMRGRAFLIFAFSLPLLSLVFYAHAYKYFYTFLLAPLSFVVATGLERFMQRREIITIFLPIFVLGFAAIHAGKSLKQSNDYQRDMLAEVHNIFPEPVAYIDRCSMVSSYSKEGLFMSYIQMYEYHEKGEPVMAQAINTSQPKFILANLPVLDIEDIDNVDADRALLAEDAAILRRHYIHHWGPIYVAGQHFSKIAMPTTIDILIEGDYTVETETFVIIDGQTYNNGDIVELMQGEHLMEKFSGSDLTLRWGRNLRVPDYPAPKRPLFAYK